MMERDLEQIIKGNIITVANQKPRAEAIGIKGEKIVSVGAIKEVESSIGKATKVLDLKGKTVLPGFFDTHAHPMATGRNRLGVDLSSVATIAETLEKIRERARNTPAGKWVFCPAYNKQHVAEKRFPTLKELDDISTKHPISIQHVDGHFSMLNSTALKLLHMDAGRKGVVIDSDGKPVGIIEDPASGQTLETIGALTNDAERMEALMIITKEAASVGITTLYAKEPLEVIEFMLKNIKKIPVRIHPMVMGATKGILAFENVVKADFLGDHVCVATAADGSIEAHTAALFEPYADDAKTLGMLVFSDEELYDFVEKAHKAGFQISIHAESERCIEQVLWAYEKALEKYPRKDHRHRIEHFELPSMRQIKRAARLGVVAAMQPIFIPICEGPNLSYYRVLLGDERTKKANAFRSILDQGILISGGSDTPVTRMNPLAGIHACVNHPVKEQRVDVYEAIEMFTINGAKTGFEEDIKGSIEPGKLADFVVLSDDPYRVPREKIRDIKVEATIVGGKVVYKTGT
jgi:predicted amidohydrolase YtcJ